MLPDVVMMFERKEIKMRRFGLIFTVFILAVAFALSSCGPQKAGSSKEAIDIAKTMATTQEQTKYLIGQAKAYINSDEFQNAIDVLQYVLRYLDKDSPEAKELLKKAQEDLTAQLKQKAEEARKAFSG